MIDFFTHLGAAILFYAVLKNNPKLQKRADALLTMAAVPLNLLKGRITKLFSKND